VFVCKPAPLRTPPSTVWTLQVVEVLTVLSQYTEPGSSSATVCQTLL